MKKNPLLSVIVPAYNEEEVIGQCIESLLNQTYQNFEIFIVDDGSTDSTPDIVKRYAQKNKKISLLKGPHKGPGNARNLGAKSANGEILILVDADMTFDKDYTQELIKPIISGKAIGTEDGKQIASNKDNIWSRCWGTYFKNYPHQTNGWIFRAILKSEFDRMGGFDPSFGYADDLTFYFKYGVQSLRVPSAICYHKNPETLNEIYRQSRWIGASIRSKLVTAPIINYLVPPLLWILSPLAIPLLSIRQTLKTREYSLFFPWMFLFIWARYFGTTKGLINKIYYGKNTR